MKTFFKKYWIFFIFGIVFVVLSGFFVYSAGPTATGCGTGADGTNGTNICRVDAGGTLSIISWASSLWNTTITNTGSSIILVPNGSQAEWVAFYNKYSADDKISFSNECVDTGGESINGVCRFNSNICPYGWQMATNPYWTSTYGDSHSGDNSGGCDGARGCIIEGHRWENADPYLEDSGRDAYWDITCKTRTVWCRQTIYQIGCLLRYAGWGNDGYCNEDTGGPKFTDRGEFNEDCKNSNDCALLCTDGTCTRKRECISWDFEDNCINWKYLDEYYCKPLPSSQEY